MERRRFSRREKAALYLAADGRCESCGAELAPGWHGDHVQPWSKDGVTDVINGQALCPDCNLKKGNKVTDLRDWQRDALDDFLKTTNGDFLVVAVPGAGKTRFALAATRAVLDRSEAQRIIVVVPTSHLRGQWAGAAAGQQIHLDSRFENGTGVLARDYHGLVVTYQAVASQPLLYRKLTSDRRTVVILDEVHHGGDTLAWGEALRTAFEPAARRLLLSGTPDRTDSNPVPFVRYDDKRCFVADYSYEYGRALQDGSVVRPIEFLALDGNVRWRYAGAITAVNLTDVDEDTRKNALSAAFDSEGAWISSVLRKADEQLTRHRAEVPDAGGLVIASDQFHAKRYERLLERVSGEKPTVAISDEPDSSKRIAAFAAGSSRWIIAVQMVSEGVDIPRLVVGVYASRITTDLFFRQVVGRFVRTRSLDDVATATLLIPSIPPLLTHAQNVETMIASALAEKQEKTIRDIKEKYEQTTLDVDFVEPVDSTEAVHHSTILSGDTFDDEELARADAAARGAGMPGSVSAAMMARALRIAGLRRVVGTGTIKVEKTRSMVDEKTSLRRLIKNKVGRLAYLTDTPHNRINYDLNKRAGDKVATATIETLNLRLELLDRWIQEQS